MQPFYSNSPTVKTQTPEQPTSKSNSNIDDTTQGIIDSNFKPTVVGKFLEIALNPDRHHTSFTDKEGQQYQWNKCDDGQQMRLISVHPTHDYINAEGIRQQYKTETLCIVNVAEHLQSLERQFNSGDISLDSVLSGNKELLRLFKKYVPKTNYPQEVTFCNAAREYYENNGHTFSHQ